MNIINWIKRVFQKTSINLNPSSSPALIRFLKSMHIGYAEWHDGVGYDLNALKECLASKNIDVKLFAARYLKEKNVVDRLIHNS